MKTEAVATKEDIVRVIGEFAREAETLAMDARHGIAVSWGKTFFRCEIRRFDGGAAVAYADGSPGLCHAGPAT